VQTLETTISDPRADDELRRLARDSGRGSAGAFADLAGRMLEPVRRWAGRLVDDPDEADDIAQVVLLRLHQRVEQFEGRSRFTTWLYRLTRNVALDRRRTAQRRAGIREAQRLEMHGAVVDPPSATALDAEALAALVRHHRRALTRREREVFDRVDLGGMPTAEAAAALGIAPSTARVLLARARRTIRLRMLAEHPDLLEEYWS
jgi:RNA polymerase sigma-70 factor (ECF subfamily)